MDVHEILKGLAIPRLMGSEGEAKTIKYLLEHLKSVGTEPRFEEFAYSPKMPSYLTKCINIFFIVIIVYLVLIISLNPLVLIISLVTLVLLLTILIILLIRWIVKNGVPQLGIRRLGNNIVGEIKPKNELKGEILLSCHYDSKSYSFSRKFVRIISAIKGKGFALFILLVLISSAGELVGIPIAFVHWLDLLTLILSAPIIGCAFISLFNKADNQSPGAIDNGTGCAIVLKLVENFGNDHLTNMRLVFLFVGAEEFGLYGSSDYCNTHLDELEAIKDRFYQINVDMVGSEIQYLEKQGILKKKPMSKILNDLIVESAEEKNIAIRPFRKSVGLNSDHALFFLRGFETCTFTSEIDERYIHSKQDTIDKVDPEKLRDAVEIIKSMIQKLDCKFMS
ncbi:MAG: M28 family metallopeptidase [Candidatus Hermodarchaeota archaeon]